MRLFIDADGCPVVNRAIAIASRWGVEVILICDSAHRIEREGATTHTVLKGADSADFYLVNRIQKGDVAVTQDYGLAAMCLAKGARALHQNGLEFTEENIDQMLLQRHESRKLRRAGGHMKGPAPRTKQDDLKFEAALERIFREEIKHMSKGTE